MLKKVSSLEVEGISVRFTAFSLKTSASATSAINGIGKVTLLVRRGDLGLATASDNEPSSEGLTKLKCLLDLSVFPSTPEGLLLKVAVSLNHQDFSKPCVDPILCLSCEPQSIFPTSYSTLTTPELPTEICIRGSGFPPSSAVSTLIRISLTPHAMDAIVLHARSELASELYFTAPTYQDIVNKLRYQENDDMGSFQVFVGIVVNGMLVNASHPFALTLYTPLPLILSTYLVRKKGGTTLTIDSDCFTFQAEDARLRFTIPSLDIAQDKQVALTLQEAAPALLLSTEDGLDGSEISKKYQIKMDLPPLSELFSASKSSISEALSSSETSVSMNPEQMVGALATGTTMTVSLLLNGITLPPVEHVVALTIFDGLKAFVCKSTVKGGMAALSTAIISCQGLLASENCIVRLIGGKGNSLDVVNAIVNEEESTVSFVIPEEVSSLLAAETKAKVKYYFVAISIDGGLTFDRSETAILGLK